MRDMARVVTLNNIVPMLNKDRIICAEFKETAYTCIVPKETAHIGDFYIMFEADAILPEKPEFEFLRKRCYKEELHGFLIKAMTMGQREDGTRVKSWCLCMKPNEVGLTEKEIEKLKSGRDLTERLEVRKYEPIEDASPTSSFKRAYPKWVKFCLSHFMFRWIGKIWMNNHQNSAGGFPDGILLRSDEITVQNMPFAIEKFADELVYISAKMEGQSCVSFDTLVETENGPKQIGELVESNFRGNVLSYNETTEECEFKPVTETICLENNKNVEWYELELNDGRKLKITGNDKVYLPELKCYRLVSELKPNDKFLILQ